MRLPRIAVLLVGPAVLLSGCLGTPATDTNTPSPTAQATIDIEWGPLVLTSTDVREGEPIPPDMMSGSLAYCDGPNISPQASWSVGPEGTTSYAIHFANTSYDEPRTYWFMYDIPIGVTSVESGGSNALEGRRGLNVIGLTYYIGPCLEWDSAHTFEFTIYALDAEFGERGVGHVECMERMEGHVLDVSTINATATGAPKP